ncbi:MAG: phage holin family protein [Candidatus Eremiobacteraeota bacterium]|nr:phage holin family protein [Candidatus Eremiobacteraeota bacterium]MCW5866405.1 phage holin family protein [Candidatus Eremiobacteraeota bacterium]
MLNQLKEEVTPLLRGIVADTQTLMRQEVALARSEVRQDLKVATQVAAGFAVGAVVAIVAGLLLCLALADYISWSFPEIPLWGSLLAVGMGLGVAAVALLANARREARELDLAPRETINSLKENAKWIAQTI